MCVYVSVCVYVCVRVCGGVCKAKDEKEESYCKSDNQDYRPVLLPCVCMFLCVCVCVCVGYM